MKPTQPTPSEALKRLKDGNQRFVSGLRSVDSIASSLKREDLARNGQTPFAIVLTCSDSRVPAEHVFDAGLGDLFVVRVAGNIVAPSLIASIEFAALSFGTPICVVMGHSKCGAVQGAVKGALNHAQSLTPNLKILIDELQPAARVALATSTPNSPASNHLDNLVKTATEINVQHSIERLLSSSEALRDLKAEGKFQVVGAIYDIESGRVGFFDQPNSKLPDKTTPSLHGVKVPKKEQRNLDAEFISAT